MSVEQSIILGAGHLYGDPPTRQALVALPIGKLMHTHCIGKSSYGKSRFLASYFLMLLSRGVSATLIDPAGDLSRLVLEQLIATGFFDHSDAMDKLVYLDIPKAARLKRYVPFNVLSTGQDADTTSSLALEAFKRVWPSLAEGSSTTIEILVKMGSYVLAVNNIPLLPYLHYLFANEPWREQLLRNVKSDMVLNFFRRYKNKQLQPSMEPTLKRIDLLAFSPVLRYSLGQRDNPIFNFRRLLDENRSLIINLNLPDPDAMRLWGCFLTVYAETGALSRGEIPARERRGKHMLILDEFQNFTAQSDTSLRKILDECRKQGLLLCLAHQSWSQVPERLAGALNNCDVRVAFKLERSDALKSQALLHFPYDPYLVKYPAEYTPQYRPPVYYSRIEQEAMHADDIIELEQREAFVRLPNTTLYRMQSLEVNDPMLQENIVREVEEYYLQRYFRSEGDIDREIGETLGGVITPSQGERNFEPTATMEMRPERVERPDAEDFGDVIF